MILPDPSLPFPKLQFILELTTSFCFLIAMNKTRDNEYLFAKMSISMDESDVGHVLLENKHNSQIPPTRAFNFEPEPKDNDGQTVTKWLNDNMMLLVTLIGVFVGVVVGEYLHLAVNFSEIIANHSCSQHIKLSDEWKCVNIKLKYFTHHSKLDDEYQLSKFTLFVRAVDNDNEHELKSSN